MMGTRTGDIDPSIVDFLEMKEGLTAREIEALLNKQSGLLGVSGLTNDMRDLLDEIHEHDDRRAKLAVAMFCYRAKKYIGAYLAAMGGADAVVFTGGIGENAPEIRARICEGLEWFGLKLDPVQNQALVNRKEGIISQEASRLAAYVIPTDEELLIARDTARCVAGVPNPY
jgi:acetate kinase